MITLIPVEYLQTQWPILEPMIQKSIDLMPGRYETVDLFILINQGRLVLWAAFDDETKKPLAAWTTKVYEVPMGRVMTIEWVGGGDVHSWVDDAMKTMDSYARDQKCIKVEGYGRDGWTFFNKNDGWKRLAIMYEKDL